MIKSILLNTDSLKNQRVIAIKQLKFYVKKKVSRMRGARGIEVISHSIKTTNKHVKS